MKLGNFSELAQNYIHRPGYCLTALKVLKSYIQSTCGQNISVADVGAGTGKLSELLRELNLSVVAVEPNDEMRAEGVKNTSHMGIEWLKGSAESTGLDTASADWLTMASSFHWVERQKALPEFHRVIKPGGFLTVLWNPRNIQENELQKSIDDKIKSLVPNLKRVSSGAKMYTENVPSQLRETGHFGDVFFLETDFAVTMTKERYLGAWKSVNDIQVQAGPQVFSEIISFIAEQIENMDQIIVPYKTRAWTARRLSS